MAVLRQRAAALPGAVVGTPVQAAQYGEALLLAVPYSVLAEVLVDLPESVAGKVVLTCVSGLGPDFSGATIGLNTDRTESVAEEISRLLPASRAL